MSSPQLAVGFVPAVHPPGEVIFACGDLARALIFLHKGLVSYGVSCVIKKAGDSIGEESLVRDARYETAARALTFVLAYTISQDHLQEVGETFAK